MKLVLSHRLALGFASIITLTVAVGAVSIWKLNQVVHVASDLTGRTLPQQKAVSMIGDNVIGLRVASRSFGLTGDIRYAEQCEKLVEAMSADMNSAEKIARGRPDLAEFAEAIEGMRKNVASYVELAGRTRETFTQIHDATARMSQAAATFDAAAIQVQRGQEQKIKDDLVAGKEAGHLDQRRTKLVTIVGVKDELDSIRLAIFKAIADRDMPQVAQAPAKVRTMLDGLKPLDGMFTSGDDARNLEAMKSSLATYAASLDQRIQLEAALAGLNNQRGEAGTALTTAIDQESSEADDETAAASNLTAATLTTTRSIIIGGLVLAAVIGAAAAFLIARGINKLIARLAERLGAGASQTAAAARQVAQAGQSLAQGSSEQAASLEEASSSLEEMSSMTHKNADSATQASALAGEARAASHRGNLAMEKMTAAINQIQGSASETAKIIKVIDEIAFQTNLLALNAAVEAARAGEAGKGFAVVAEEVRNLAMRSAEAARNTSSLIAQSVDHARGGVAITDSVADALKEINTSAERAATLIDEIAAAGREQALGIEQINTSVSQMDKVTQQVAASAEESAAASEEMSAQADELRVCARELADLVGLRMEAAGAERPIAAAQPSPMRLAA